MTPQTPTIGSAADAETLMEKLALEHLVVSVFWDRGWGDSPLKISVVTDGNGQDPHAYLTPDAYAELLTTGVIRPNSLQTMKARKLHDYRFRHPFATDGGATCRDCGQGLDHVDHAGMGLAAWVEPERDIAHRLAPDLLAGILKTLDTAGVPVTYTLDTLDPRRLQELTVHVSTSGLEFMVNAFGRNGILGCDILPISERGTGEFVPFGGRPDQPGWAAQVAPRLAETITLAAAVVRAHRDGTTCGHQLRHESGDRTITRHCLRQAHHDQQPNHSDTCLAWTDDGKIVR